MNLRRKKEGNSEETEIWLFNHFADRWDQAVDATDASKSRATEAIHKIRQVDKERARRRPYPLTPYQHIDQALSLHKMLIL
eukprot:CAMPEP_0197285344 /NCGR_PEP_ID=MMETSP0890-20130614/565_1 /TAXON_ID=44058 ORGANISM="Aureoumbra lagunensis, Strain CCMP1510" /NCGR_SAMPLE_ID=MMETSP0890 /ASSEMBLY_ACC=CAM_ASM_000533 /LENGTH=80 /DNA_ID=CAMNT_0042752715 /DNA_START=78 /DNA_END=320 /DNA_ORIENTATION=-